MDCGRCGSPLEPGQRFCGRCGAAAATDDSPTPLTTPLQVVEQTPVAPWNGTGTWADTPPEGWHPDDTPPVPIAGIIGPPRITVLVVLAALSGAATVFAATSRLFTIEADGVQLQSVKANVFENVTGAALVGALVLVAGAVLGSTGRRLGTGLAGGAGLAVAGLAATFVALALSSFDQAEKDATAEGLAVTLRFVTEVGFWAFAAAGVLGLVVGAMSCVSGPDGMAPLHGLVATLGVLATAAVAVGPMLPREGVSIADNFTTDPSVWPTVAKCTSLGLVLLAGWVGFAGVRRWGVGLALGGISVGLWLWVTTLVQDDAFVMGIGVVNPGSFDFSPHPVTSIGVVGMVGAAAAMLALDARSRSN